MQFVKFILYSSKVSWFKNFVNLSKLALNFHDKNLGITLNFCDSMIHFSASMLYRPPCDFQFREKNFRDLEVNHKIHKNIVHQKLGAYGNWLITCWSKSQLSTDHIGIRCPPKVITHSAPGIVVAQLNSTFTRVTSTTKPDAPLDTT